MAVSHQDLMQFAAESTTVGSSEAGLRSAISRSYYAAYHALMPFVTLLPESERFREEKRISHFEMQQRIKEWKTDGISPKLSGMSATKGQLFRALEAAALQRVVADYRLKNEVSLADAQSQIARVKQILRQVTQIENQAGPALGKASGLER